MDRVLIQKAEAVAKTKGGIIIPEKAQSKVCMFYVSDTHPPRNLIPPLNYSPAQFFNTSS